MSCHGSRVGRPFKLKYAGFSLAEEEGPRLVARVERQSPAIFGAQRQQTLDGPLHHCLPRILQARRRVQLSARAFGLTLGYGLSVAQHQCFRRDPARRRVDRWSPLFGPPDQVWLHGSARQLSGVLVLRRQNGMPIGTVEASRLALRAGHCKHWQPSARYGGLPPERLRHGPRGRRQEALQAQPPYTHSSSKRRQQSLRLGRQHGVHPGFRRRVV